LLKTQISEKIRIKSARIVKYRVMGIIIIPRAVSDAISTRVVSSTASISFPESLAPADIMCHLVDSNPPPQYIKVEGRWGFTLFLS
jgi:hypothetical protein